MSRETSPWSAETALARRESLSPSTVMQNSSAPLQGFSLPKPHELVLRESHGVAKRPQVFLDQIGAESVMSCRHGRMRREHHFPAYARNSRIERNAFLLHAAANRFEHHEAAVSFVQMKHARRDAHRFQRAEARRRPAAFPAGCERAGLRHRAAK